VHNHPPTVTIIISLDLKIRKTSQPCENPPAFSTLTIGRHGCPTSARDIKLVGKARMSHS